jgi:hypothetical protein
MTRRALLSVVALLGLPACGARTGLLQGSQGSEGGSAAGGGGGGADDPDIECPLVCTEEECLPVVLLEDTLIGWHAVDGDAVYYTTANAEGPNGLFRASVCNGEPELLLERQQFLGYGAVIDDEVFVTSAEPTVEVLRVPKSGGEPTLYYSDPAAVPRPFGFVHYRSEIVLVMYHFDGSYGLYQLGEGAELIEWGESMPDPDWFSTPADGFGFVPNIPVIDDYDESLSLWAGSALGVFETTSYSPPQVATNVAVAGPIVAELPEGGSALYFTGETDTGRHHYQLPAIYMSQPSEIMAEQSGLIMAVDDDVLFGASARLSEHAGIVWRALPTDVEASPLFRSAEFVQDIAIGKESVYVRTETRLVRVPKLCPSSSTAPCVVLD